MSSFELRKLLLTTHVILGPACIWRLHISTIIIIIINNNNNNHYKITLRKNKREQ